MAHTPTPWRVFTATNGLYIGVGEPNGEGILDAGFGVWREGPEAIANAAFIVKAVNAHDELVAALQALISNLPYQKHRDIALAALAKAGAA